MSPSQLHDCLHKHTKHEHKRMTRRCGPVTIRFVRCPLRLGFLQSLRCADKNPHFERLVRRGSMVGSKVRHKNSFVIVSYRRIVRLGIESKKGCCRGPVASLT